MTEETKEGVIELDSEFAKEIGFTSDKFQGYLWKAGDYVYISAIKSIHPEQGNLSTLLACIEEKGFNTKVPTPLLKWKLYSIKKDSRGQSRRLKERKI